LGEPFLSRQTGDGDSPGITRARVSKAGGRQLTRSRHCGSPGGSATNCASGDNERDVGQQSGEGARQA
jgi:hypothetical protein